jgi:tetratricopeptide (TPR) repeat protein
MGNFNRGPRDAPAPNARPPQWPLSLIWIGVVVALVLGLNTLLPWPNPWQRKQAHDDYQAFMQAALTDDAMADPLQRCLQGPDLPHTHWHRDTTELYCETLARPTLSFEQVDALLQRHDAAGLDRTFDAYLNTQRHDPRQPGVFDQAFVTAGFDSNEEAVRRLADRWKQLSPQSTAALTASGMQYLDAAIGMPAPDWSNDWPDGGPDNPDPLLALARADLEHAIALQPANTMAYRELLLVDAMQGDTDAMTAAALGALSVDPASFGIRSQLISLAQPVWGNNFGGLSQQVQQTQAWLSHNPLLRIVLSKPAVFATATCCGLPQPQKREAWQHAVDDNVSIFDLWDLGEQAYAADPTWSAMMFTESLRFRPRDAYALHWRAQALLELGNRAAALDSIQRIARRYPQDNPIQLQLGWMEAETGHPQQAEQVYLGVLQRDPANRRAMAWLGDLYNRRLHEPAKAMPLAQQLLALDPNNPEGLIVQAFAQMGLSMPDRYTHIHDFIDRFGDQDMFEPEVAQMRAYLHNHPENSGLK